MERIAPIPLDKYLQATASFSQPERTFTTFADIDDSDEVFSSEILCTTEETADGTEGATLRRIGKNVLQLGTKTVTLSPSEVRICNSLLINKGTPLCTPEIQRVADRGKSVVHYALKKLIDKLQDSNGEPLIQQSAVVMPDARQAHNGYAFDSTISVKASDPDTPARGAILRKEQLHRILSLYRNTSGLQQKIGFQRSRELQAYASLPKDINSKSYKTLKTDEFYDLYRTIDNAVATFEESQEPWDIKVSEGVLAWHAVYYSGLGMVRAQVRSFEYRSQLYEHHDDLAQIGAIELWRATMQYDATKASFPHYAIRRIISGFSQMLAGHITRGKHYVPLDMHAAPSEGEPGVLPNNFIPTTDNTEGIPLRLFNDGLASHVVNHDLLRPSERLVLSLYFGIYSAELDGMQLTTANDTTLFYDSALPKNPVFRDGLSQEQIASIVNLSHMQVYRIWQSGMDKAHDIALTKVHTDIDFELYESPRQSPLAFE